MSNNDIAVKLNMASSSISCILRSPAAQAEMSRLASLAVEKSVDIPTRVALHNELVGAAADSVRINHTLMRDPFVKPETRSRIGQHFMDRVIFNHHDNGDREQESYRDILRKLDKLQATIQPLPVPEIIEAIPVVNGNGKNGHSVNDNLLDNQLKYLMGTGPASQPEKHIIDLGEDD